MTGKILPHDALPDFESEGACLPSTGGCSSRMGRRHLLLGLVTFSVTKPALADDPLVVIVNKGNVENPSLSDLAAVFTTRKQSWPNGQRILPFNFPPKHPARVEFDHSVLQMNPAAVARYWIDRRIRAGNPPPKQVNNAQLVVRLVAKLPGAVAYVPRSMVDASVRVADEL
jgi:hypothetical protein